MRADSLISALSMLVGLTLTSGATAQTPASIAGQAEFERGQQQMATMVIGAPRAASAPSQADKRPYRDPTIPLTIGEMAEIQRQKATEDFLKKAGFTTEKPAPQEEAKNGQVAPPEKVERRVAARAIYGKAGAGYAADVLVDDVLTRVGEGAVIAGRFTVKSIEPSGLVLTMPSTPSDCRRLSQQQRRKCLAESKTLQISVGQHHSWFE